MNTTFLNGTIDEQVYTKQPKEFEVHWKETHDCRSKKDIYDLEKPPRARYSCIGTYLIRHFFIRHVAYPNLHQNSKEWTSNHFSICGWVINKKCGESYSWI